MGHLAARERRATAELIAHLVELEARDLHRAAGYGSMFSYCCDVLHLSEHEAYNRIEVSRAARRFPVILDLLLQGAVNLTTVRLLAPHLNTENHHAVLQSARGLRRAQVEELVARLAPRPDVPASLRKLPDATAGAAAGMIKALPAREPVQAGEATPDGSLLPVPTRSSVSVQPPPEAAVAVSDDSVPPLPVSPSEKARADIRPLSPARFKM